MVICLERHAELYMAQLIPLPLTISCCSKIQLGFTFLVLAHPGSPGKSAVKRECVCKHNKCMFAHNVVDVSTSNTTVQSKDGKLTVTGSPRIARKKGQHQRPRAERTIRPLK